MTANGSLINIISIISPVFIIISIGYLAVRFGSMPKSGVKVLGAFVINFALPSMLFKVISERSISEIINPHYIFAYTTGSLVAFLFSLFLVFYIRKRSLSTSAIMGMGGSISNSGFIGYPIVIQTLGPSAEVPFVLTLLIEIVIMVPITLTIADSALNKNENFLKALAKSAVGILKSPLIIAIILGISSSTLLIQPKAEIKSAIDMLAMASGPVALFFIGGSLVGIKVKGLKTDIGITLFGKLVIHPMAILVTFLFFPAIDSLFRTAAVVLACSPMFSIFPVFGQKFGLESICSATLVPTTILSFISISTIIWILLNYTPFG